MKSIFYYIIAIAVFTACTKDKEKPTIEINSPSDGARVSFNANVQLDFICKDNKELHDVEYTITATVNNRVLASEKKDVDEKEYAKSINFAAPPIPSGIVINIKAEDHAGNSIEKTISIFCEP